ncbi:hypothetical protein Poli38472_011807 [Pythium oligandrum]|uniref:6,7-dimethyl-8-ribityllumazine synthase n=1 Tax=Pythium oligandrum TaxID=41045 RepID=A0A8K1C855_PYTOL|nr:hypothetical protein Poli38472_011807 [Pythium oligandrum]|eukprot:TMW58219.1 hypothetical protein Poli38472_011807 [Pythium oligandrum]
MATNETHRSASTPQDADGFCVGIVSAHAKAEIVGPLVAGTKKALIERGIARRDIVYMHGLRPFDLPFMAKRLMESEGGRLDGVICLGLLVRDEMADQFAFQSEAVARGIMKLNVKGKVPVIYGVLTCESEDQAQKFLGMDEGVSADHGWEWAKALVELVRLNRQLEHEP